MAEVKSGYSDYVKFILRSEVLDKLVLDHEPIGWSEDGLEYVRHTKYHGIIIEFTGDLSFYGESRNYIIEDFDLLGLNSNLRLDKYELVDTGDTVKWELTYSGIVDYTTKMDEDFIMKLKFNSNKLEELIKTRENDEFDLEREFSIDEVLLEDLATNKIDIDGVPLNEYTTLTLKTDDTIADGAVSTPEDSDYARGEIDYQHILFRGGAKIITPILTLDVDGNNRVSSPDTTRYDADYASKMFFVDSVAETVDDELITSLSFSYSLDADVKTVSYQGSDSRHTLYLQVAIMRVIRNNDTLEYDIVDIDFLDLKSINRNGFTRIQVSGEKSYSNIRFNEGLLFGFIGQEKEYASSNNKIRFEAKVYETNLNVMLHTFKPTTYNHKFLFVDECFERLMYILTSEKDRFVSRMFSRKNDVNSTDGVYGTVGLTYGLWIRQFTDAFPIYKSIKMSLNDIIESMQAVFNIGIGIELLDGKQKLVVEDLRFFYQSEVKIKLTRQISNVKRSVDKNSYFSSIEIGYAKGGNYTDTIGLDEPNVKTNRITPIIRNKKEYKKVSDFRADDIGLELIRRKPASINSKEDTEQDEHIWFLDVKKPSSGSTTNWIQKIWSDRLSFKPTGLSYGEYFKSFLFSPLRMIFRHGSILRAGLNEGVNLVKKISHVNSEANSNLHMQFKEDIIGYTESENIQVKELDQPLTFPEIIEFTHPLSTELIRLIKAKSEIILNNEKVSIPNYYFKIEFTNENSDIERGYILGFNPKDSKFKILKSNEKITI